MHAHERGARERHVHEVHVHEIHAYEVHACEMRAYERHTLMITREMRITVRCTAVSLLAFSFSMLLFVLDPFRL